MTSLPPAPDAAIQPFRPAPGFSNPHLQTLVGRALRSRNAPPLKRERWELPDGDFLDLDFSADAGDETRPLVLVLHGLEGGSRRNYCLESYRALARHGVASVGLNFRSCSGEMNRTARAYHSGETGDLRLVVERLQARWPGRALGLLGFSLGGNVLLKALGEGLTGVHAAAAVSVPYDLLAGSRHLESTPLGRAVYTRYFMRSLQRKIRLKADLVRQHVPLEPVLRARTLSEFDAALTAPLHGFDGADDYYRRSSSAPWLPHIRVPTLLLHSVDDPFLPPQALPREAMHDNPLLTPVLTRRGGHVGFFGGSARVPEFWAETSAAGFLATTLRAP